MGNQRPLAADEIRDLDAGLRLLCGAPAAGLPEEMVAALRQLHNTLGVVLAEAGPS